MPCAYSLTFFVIYLSNLPLFCSTLSSSTTLYMQLTYQISNDIIKMIVIIRKRCICHSHKFTISKLRFQVHK